MNTELLEALRRVPAIGILRGCPFRHAEGIAEVAVGAGFVVLEVTLDSPDPYRSIERIASALPETLVGAGTVRSVGDVRAAIDSGAAFLVCPAVDATVIAEATSRGIPILPGAATPTEISRALQAGAAAVKVFPAIHLGGPDFIHAISGPLGSPLMVPTGGVTADNARLFLTAGAFAVGVGGSVFPRAALEAGDVERVRSAASSLIKEIT